jgi:large subunit ribosomal protein L6
MSRFSKIPVKIAEKVEVKLLDGKVEVKGPKGTMERTFPREAKIEIKDGVVLVTGNNDSKFGRAIQGTVRSHIVNMIKGVTEGWSKKLELVGTGYRAEIKDNNLVLTVGFSHPVIINAEEGIKFGIEKNTITVEGMDKQLVGEVAANIKAVRKPDPYKGKGIRYFGEVLKLKPGKQAAKTGAA